MEPRSAWYSEALMLRRNHCSLWLKQQRNPRGMRLLDATKACSCRRYKPGRDGHVDLGACPAAPVSGSDTGFRRRCHDVGGQYVGAQLVGRRRHQNVVLNPVFAVVGGNTDACLTRLSINRGRQVRLVPIFLLAEAFNIEPSVPLINWFNVVTHGLIALAVAFTAYNIARLNRLPVVACGLLAVAVAFPILYPRGLVYFFSQVYCYTIAILLYAAVFILLESLSYTVESARDRKMLFSLQLLVIYAGIFRRLAVLYTVRILAAHSSDWRLLRPRRALVAAAIERPGADARQRFHALPGVAFPDPWLNGQHAGIGSLHLRACAGKCSIG